MTAKKWLEEHCEHAMDEMAGEVIEDEYLIHPADMDEYAELMCKEQREICARAFDKTDCQDGHKWRLEKIKNAPSPDTSSP